MRRPRVLHEQGPKGGKGAGETAFVEIDAERLAHVFAVPSWLRDLGLMAWLVVGVLLLLGGVVWLLALTSVIVVPVITAAIIAAVLSPVVGWLARHRVGRGEARLPSCSSSSLALGVGNRRDAAGGRDEPGPPAVRRPSTSAVDKAESASSRTRASARARRRARATTRAHRRATPFHALLKGVGTGVSAFASLAAFLSFTALSLFFLLKDGPLIRPWTESHLGLPHASAARDRPHAEPLRGYCRRHGGGRLQRGRHRLGARWSRPAPGRLDRGHELRRGLHPVPGRVVGRCVHGPDRARGGGHRDGPGRWRSSCCSPTGSLQQLVQPIAFVAALRIHPLAVLIVTLAGGSLRRDRPDPGCAADLGVGEDRPTSHVRAAAERAGPEPAAAPT